MVPELGKPINPTKLLLESRTSTANGGVSPKPRWCRGTVPEEEPTIDDTGTDTTTTTTPTSELSCSSRLTSPELSDNKNDRPCVAWAWVMEDQGELEVCLQVPTGGVVLPQLLIAEKELLCRAVEQRLLEVGRSSPAVTDLVHEYLKFTFLRERLEGVLTLSPSVLVDDVLRAHITCESEYAAFCDRSLGQGPQAPHTHHAIQDSKPVLYENAVRAYTHFFGTNPPSEAWPPLPERLDGDDGDGEEEEKPDSSGRRTTFVRLPEEKYAFKPEGPTS